MDKERYFEFGNNRDGFKIIPESAIMGLPDGVSGEMLWNLWDIGSKFGQGSGKGLGFKSTPLVLELNDFRNNGMGGSAGLTVAKARDTGIMDEGVFIFELENGVRVIWDKGLSVESVNASIVEIDEFAMAADLMKDGMRIDMGRPATSGKMMVEQIFSRKNNVMMVQPGRLDEALSDFDHPELLAVIDTGAFQLLCLASELDEIVADMTEKYKKLQAMGVDLTDVANMSVEELMEIRGKL